MEWQCVLKWFNKKMLSLHRTITHTIMEDKMFEFQKNALQGVLTDPLCAEYRNDWRVAANDKRKLVDLVMRQQSLPYFFEHCYKGKGLTCEYIKENFADYINGKYRGIDVDGVKGDYKTELYVGYEGVFSPSDDVLALMWSTIPSLEISPCKATKIYIGCNSHVTLTCDGYNSIVVMLFDDSSLTLDFSDENTNVTIYKYSATSSVNMERFFLGKVKIFEKTLRI